ncbi:hypothetical protein R5O20_02700 [Tenacibaculum maritimum]|uniref:hypothetical protein n=1 Tax=Tenacibaculum maritimum TaxID=107401 RepID=UPI0038901CBB
MTIIAEERFIELFNTLPVMNISNSEYKPQYDFGSEEDLLKYLNQKHKEGGKVYPLIWLETPIVLEGDKRKKSVFKFVLATLSNSELSNKGRLEVTIKPTLVPLKNNMLKAFKQSGFTRVLNRDRKKQSIHYNFGTKDIKSKKQESQASDIWDAIKFEVELEITGNRVKKINY